jgi:hypothetical protein
MERRGGRAPSLEVAWRRLMDVLEYDLGAKDIVVSTNVGIDPATGGLRSVLADRVRDPGVAVYFTYDRQDYAISCDAYRAVRANIAAIAGALKHLQALVAIDPMIARTALAGLEALPTPLHGAPPQDEARAEEAAARARQAREEAAAAAAAKRQAERDRQAAYDQWCREQQARARASGARRQPAGGSNWWTVLGVSQFATTAEIKSAYRRLARQHHPDVGGQAEKFVEITRAYEQTQARGR